MKKLFPYVLILAILVLSAGCATPLYNASYKGDTKAVIELLDKGESDINKQEANAFTPLMCAAANGHSDTVRVLLDRGADIHATGRSGDALFWAAAEGHADVVKLLIDRGSDIDAAIASLEMCVNGTGGTVWNDRVRAGCKAGFISLKRLAKQQQPSRQSETIAAEPSREAYPTIKSDVDELPVIKTKRNKNAYAIIIGIENYRQKLPKADFAVSDAKLVSEYLSKVMGYPEENVVTLTNEHASKSDFEKYFEKWLSNNAEKDSTIFVYYSGHGAPNTKTGDAYLVPYDGDPSFIEQTGYPLKKLYESLNKLQAREIIVALDSCFSGAGGRSVIAKGARPLIMNLQSNMVLSKNMTVLSASSSDQTSSTYDEKGHGLFTYFLLKGIKNEDVVKPDGSIKMEDLFDYIKPQVERIARKQYNNEQTPQLIGHKASLKD
jgi:hypothetical protein